MDEIPKSKFKLKGEIIQVVRGATHILNQLRQIIPVIGNKNRKPLLSIIHPCPDQLVSLYLYGAIALYTNTPVTTRQ